MTEQTAIEKPLKINDYIRSKEIMQRFADLLGTNGAAGYVQSVLLSVSASNDLMACTPNSVISCALRAATMKLSCDPTTKQAYLVPFKKSSKNELGAWVETKVATLIVGYMGFYQMAIRTGKYRYINVYAVHGDQEVTLNPITGFHSIHSVEGDKYLIIGYLGAFEMTNGYGKTIYMTIEELIAHGQQYSKSFNDPKGKWQTAPHDMYKKTIMRMLMIHWGYLDPHDISSLNQVDEAIDLEDALNVVAKDPEFSDDPGQEPEPVAENKPDPSSNPAAQEAPTPEQAKPEPPMNNSNARPYDASTLQKMLAEKATKFPANTTCTDNERNMIAVNINLMFAGQSEVDKVRHSVLKHLTGKTSVKDLTPQQVKAMKAWINSQPDSGGEWQPDALAAKEAQSVWTAALEAAGQEKLL